MKRKFQSLFLPLALLFVFHLLHSPPAFADTDGSEIQVVSPSYLEVQLGPAFAGTEFQFRTDTGIRKGMQVLILKAHGYTSKEIGVQMQLPANAVRTLASRTRAYIRKLPEYAARLLVPLLTLAICVTVFKSVFFWGYVPSSSMEPTLKRGSIIFGYCHFKDLKTGDIIVFEHDGKLLVKRIAACGGDIVIINDKSCAVPEDCFFVLGDNADNSLDSRYWSDPFVPLKDVVARVFA